MTEIIFAYARGQMVEARDPATNQWRRGVVIDRRPYRGRAGYDVSWHPAPATPSSGSAGGWQCERFMRRVS